MHDRRLTNRQAQWGYFENSKLKRNLAKLYYVKDFYFLIIKIQMQIQNVFVPNVLEIFIYEIRGESPGGGVSRQFRL